MTPENLLQIVGFSISFAGLVRVFLPADRNKEIVIAIILSLLLLLSVFSLYRGYQHYRLLDDVSAQIVSKLGGDRKTFDQILEDLHYVDTALAHEAIDKLVVLGKVNHKLTDVRGDLDERFRTRVYFAVK